METMKAVVFHGNDDIRVEEIERPQPGAGEAVIRVTLTTFAGPICTSCAENIPSPPVW